MIMNDSRILVSFYVPQPLVTSQDHEALNFLTAQTSPGIGHVAQYAWCQELFFRRFLKSPREENVQPSSLLSDGEPAWLEQVKKSYQTRWKEPFPMDVASWRPFKVNYKAFFQNGVNIVHTYYPIL